MPRRLPRPYGSSVSAARAVSLIFLMAIVYLLYDRFRDPKAWLWLAPESKDAPQAQAVSADHDAAPEEITQGPNDLDEAEWESWKSNSQFITDRAALRAREMPAYWQLLAWSHTQPFSELERRAKPDPAFTQLWELPSDYRGVPIRMRLHIRRVLRYDAPENPLGVQQVYEAWGWTDDSKSFPYVVVFTDPPENLPVGPEVQAEAVFAGYFLKVMSYTAFDVHRGAPLLVGRIRSINAPAAAPKEPVASRGIETYGLAIAAAIIGAGLFLWRGVARRAPPPSVALPDELNFDLATPGDPADDSAESLSGDFVLLENELHETTADRRN